MSPYSPLPPPMPLLEELVEKNRAKITTREAAVNIDAKKLALKRRQRKQVRDINKNNPICVEEHQSKQTDVKMWIPELELSSSDKEILLSPTAWLTDSIIDAAQNLLKKEFPVPGLQSVGCGLTMTFAIQPGEFIQILNTGQGHWVTISTIGTTHPTVHVYIAFTLVLGLI